MRLPVFAAALLLAAAPALAATLPSAGPALISDSAADIAFDPASGTAKESFTVLGYAPSGLGASFVQIDGAPNDAGFKPKLSVEDSDGKTLLSGVMRAFSFEGGVLRILFSTTADMTGRFGTGVLVTTPSGGATGFTKSFAASGEVSLAAPVPLPASSLLLLGGLAALGLRRRAR